MNIFKVLANGDGTINEANISAFLGYLLDPNADHALGLAFLKRFLEQVDLDDDFILEKYDYQIFFEQAFKRKGASKQIVDVIIVCYRTNLGLGKESLVKSFLSNTKVVEKIFIIENKIRRQSLTRDQLEKQLISLNKELFGADISTEVFSIYVTPNSVNFKEEFECFRKLEIVENRCTHIYWDDHNSSSIKSMLIDILNKERAAQIEALNEYTSHTIKAFVQFIASNFRSVKEEEKERKNDGTYTRRFIELNESSGIEDKLSDLKLELEALNPDFRGLIMGPDMVVKRHPKLFLIIKGVQLNIGAGYKSRDRVGLTFVVNKEVPNSKENLVKLSNRLGIKLNNPNSKYDSYSRTNEMKKPIMLSNTADIVSAVLSAIELMEISVN